MLGKRLTELRNGKGLSQAELAKMFGMSRSTYAQYEVDRRSPDYETLSKMASYFGVSVDWLLGRVNNARQAVKEENPRYYTYEDQTYDIEKILKDKTKVISANTTVLTSEQREELLGYIKYSIRLRGAVLKRKKK